jgi:hypothetical protein
LVLAVFFLADSGNYARHAHFLRTLQAYDSNLRSRTALDIAIAFDAAREAEAKDAEKAFTGDGFRAVRIKTSVLSPDLGGIALLYLLAGVLPESWRAALIKNAVLTVCSDGALAAAGKVSLALVDTGGRLRPTVHLQRAKSEGHEFSSEFLNLARVISDDDFNELVPSAQKQKRSLGGDPWN